MTLVLAVLTASLLGSPHCAAMCGAFACFANADARRGAATAIAYNAGRLVTYVALGLLAGAVGAGLDAAGELAGIARVAAIASGALMVAWGATRIAAASGVRVGRAASAAPAALRVRLGGLLGRLRAQPPVARAAATGLLTTLVPCGWLYAYVVTAAGTGSASSGALVMGAFWAGTLPVMAMVGAGARRLAGPLARRLPVVSAAVLVVIGLLTIGGRLAGVDAAHAHAATAPHATHVAR